MDIQRFILVVGTLCFLSQSIYSQKLIGPHGYLTFEAEISNKDSVGRRGTFDLHHFNIIVNYLLSPKTHVFGEIEFEHGNDLEDKEDHDTNLGFVRLERAWFEYAFSRKLKLRLGKFLTPFGIYNEFHDAAPAYNTTILPQSIYGRHENPFGKKQEFFAEFSVGVQVLGRFEFGSSNLQYQAIFTNGRGKQPFSEDDNRNKGVGVRLIVELPAVGTTAGYSFYTDKNGLFFSTRQIAHAWDFRFEHKRLCVTGEFAHSRLDAGEAAADRQIANGGYGEIAYQIFNRQTILLRYDIFDLDRRRIGDLEKDLTFATSVQALKHVLVKAGIHFIHEEGGLRQDYTLGIASLAVVF